MCLNLYVGLDPQEEKQVEKVTALGTVRKDTALLLKGFRQGASNWIHSLLDHNKTSAGVCAWGPAWDHAFISIHTKGNALVCVNRLLNNDFIQTF